MTGFVWLQARARTCAVVIAAAVLLTSCGQDAEEPMAEPSASKSTTASTSASAKPTPTPSAEVEKPPVKVTSPNGMHSFTLPTGWSAVPAEPLPIPAHDVGYVSPAGFSILDATGTQVAEFYSGVSLDGAAVPSPGHVMYDAQQLEGYTSKLGQPVFFQFESRPEYTNMGPDPDTGYDKWEVTGRSYHMQLEDGALPDTAGMDAGPLHGTVFMPDGGIRFHAVIEPGAIADDAAARAWMETDVYRQLKEMLLSLTCNA